MSTQLADISKIIDHNWTEVQEKMGKSWRKLTDKDLAGIKNFDDLIKKMKSAYEITEDEAEKKIDEFIEKHNLETNFSRLEELKNALYESATDAREKISHAIDATKEKTEDLAAVATHYVKDNPLKAIGLGVLASLAIKKLLFSKKD